MRGPCPPWRASWPLSPHAHCSRRRGQRRAAPLTACGSGTRWARVQDGPSGQGRAPSRRRLWPPGPAGSGEAASSTWTPRRQRKVYFPVNGKGTQALGPEGWNLLINTWQKSEFRGVKRSRCPNRSTSAGGGVGGQLRGVCFGPRRAGGLGTAVWRDPRAQACPAPRQWSLSPHGTPGVVGRRVEGGVGHPAAPCSPRPAGSPAPAIHPSENVLASDTSRCLVLTVFRWRQP